MIDKAHASSHAFIDLETMDFKYTPIKNREELNKHCRSKLWGEMYIAIRPSKIENIEFCYHGHNILASGIIMKNFAVYEHVDNDFYFKKSKPPQIDWELLRIEKAEIMGILRANAR